MTWWCAATGAAWTWTWRPYPGVWLLVALLAGGYLIRRRRARAADPVAWPRWRLGLYLLGVLAVWIANDWPVGALGAGYLMSLHTLQYLLLAIIAPPLLLVGLPLAPRSPDQRGDRFLRWAARPIYPLLGFNAVLLVTHIPAVVDTLMRTQWGSLLIDLSWLVTGLWLWWPVLAPDGIRRLSPLAQIGYLFASTIVPTASAAFLTFAEYPVYALYELAPRVNGISSGSDQQVAGLMMKLGADPFIWLAMAIIFFRWNAAEQRSDRLATLARAAR